MPADAIQANLEESQDFLKEHKLDAARVAKVLAGIRGVTLGVTFGDMDGSPGIDLIMPDIGWLQENRDAIGARPRSPPVGPRAAMILCSRLMSWAVASTWPRGGRRSTSGVWPNWIATRFARTSPKR